MLESSTHLNQRKELALSWCHSGITLYRFCAKHKLRLTLGQRMAAGLELTQLVRERRLPLIKVRERVKANQWGLTRLY
ncbi:MAG: hypothetical protein ACXVBG_25120, partial [Isosphaeraceae bacterium]